MATSFVSCVMHYVFSTKGRDPVITDEIRKSLWAYMGAVSRNNRMKALAVGGTADHVHILLSLSSSISVAEGIRLIKGNLSKWINETFPSAKRFAWQTGYGAFSISRSFIPRTIAYINAQAFHHRVTTFQDEYLLLLERHGIEYDLRYIWG